MVNRCCQDDRPVVQAVLVVATVLVVRRGTRVSMHEDQSHRRQGDDETTSRNAVVVVRSRNLSPAAACRPIRVRSLPVNI